MALMRKCCFSSIFLLGMLGALGTPAAAQNGSQFKDWQLSQIETVPLKPRVLCASLLSLTGYEFSVSTATVVAASAQAPEHCRVSGLIQPEIAFKVSLPATWNGRLYMFGNGGFAGEDLNAPGRIHIAQMALARGFATAQTNTGHDASREPLGTFAANPQKFLDYAYRSVHVTAVTAKKIIHAYYDGALSYSYFTGCSLGGRQGLLSAQRFPDDFDGILVGAPALDIPGTMIRYLHIQRALAAAPIPTDKLKILSDAVYDKCDAVDGLVDGLIDDPRQCAFKSASDLPRCANDEDATGCFTAAQIQTLETIYGGVKRSGTDIFSGFPLGAEIEGTWWEQSMSGWVPWLIGFPDNPPVGVSFGQTFFKYMAFSRPRPNYDWMEFDINEDLDKLQWTASVLNATDPDLSRFKTRGGKIISYFGWADTGLDPLTGINYYEDVMQHLGPSTTDFYRMFMVPGMFHCRGGVGMSTFDAFTPLVKWVEKGIAPQSIIGSKIVDGKTVQTRPLCPYPEVAKYKGSGSVDKAANFECVKP